ncbi:MAG: hypothetical protein LBG89_03195 [Rickettsiales bacterium]|jgi:hypothetical protein|nr:hypothetical protein [Rickettsiales bacterium]
MMKKYTTAQISKLKSMTAWEYLNEKPGVKKFTAAQISKLKSMTAWEYLGAK